MLMLVCLGVKLKVGSMFGSKGWEVAVVDDVYVMSYFFFFPDCFVERND
jgi:hypothetical protein